MSTRDARAVRFLCIRVDCVDEREKENERERTRSAGVFGFFLSFSLSLSFAAFERISISSFVLFRTSQGILRTRRVDSSARKRASQTPA